MNDPLANSRSAEAALERRAPPGLGHLWTLGLVLVAVGWMLSVESSAGGPLDEQLVPPEPAPGASVDGDPAEGYRLLTQKAYLPPDFDQETIDRVWEVWPEPWRQQAAEADSDRRRQMIWDRYGLTPRPDDPDKPLQYVVDAEGRWTMNCLACHGGAVAGQSLPGRPNTNYALELLTEETRRLKFRLGKQPGRMDLGSVFIPLGKNRGTTNAVMFGVALMAFRDAELNVYLHRRSPVMTHHDMDAPPWWHFHRKQNLYIDGFAPKGVRGLMQFMMVRENGPEKFREWEADFRHVYAFLESIRPPKYPAAIDHVTAERGRQVFESRCAECHGTYGPNGTYPERRIPLAEIGTDRVRFDALRAADRRSYAESWFAYYGQHRVELAPDGYVAPPLDGVWASAPYLHNGSVPTLWHLLRPDRRPEVWRRRGTGQEEYDYQRVGLAVEELAEVPAGVSGGWEVREYFDTTKFGKSHAGHDFPASLTEDQRDDLLEYLKTL
ncbi:MAG: c-type cytochrome [Pirellulales bacterium]